MILLFVHIIEFAFLMEYCLQEAWLSATSFTMLVLLTSAMETGGGDVSQRSEIIFKGICINFSLDML